MDCGQCCHFYRRYLAHERGHEHLRRHSLVCICVAAVPADSHHFGPGQSLAVATHNNLPKSLTVNELLAQAEQDERDDAYLDGLHRALLIVESHTERPINPDESSTVALIWLGLCDAIREVEQQRKEAACRR